MKIYIAGKVSGLAIKDVQEKFAKASIAILDIFPYAEIVNPVAHINSINEYRQKSGLPSLSDEVLEDRKEIMQRCLWLLSRCDVIYLQHDWINSRGAWQEKEYAEKLGLEIFKEQ